MDFDKIISTVGLVGSNLPAFKALFDQVASTFSESDQKKLQHRYDEAMSRAEDQHRKAQSL